MTNNDERRPLKTQPESATEGVWHEPAVLLLPDQRLLTWVAAFDHLQPFGTG
jgi:hypothetical protein